MVIETENTEVQTTLEGKTFKIEDNTILYNILSDRMYKNKIRAVIRELSTNAVDAQIAAGNTETAISVVLPTILEPTFKIRDYGIGLSEEDVMNLYTTYGSSTKRDSNLFNGALGLGSKSPFAYSKAFTVTSYWNGTKYMFSVYSDNGVPKIAKLGEGETTEVNGLEVSIPVQDNDISQFLTEARFVYKYFSVPVDCNLDLDTPIKDLTPTYGNDNWGVYSEVSGSWIVMANVAYKINNLDITDTGILSTSGLVVNVPIGAVQFSASREELSLTPDTITYLQKLGTKISADIDTIVDKAIADIEEGDSTIGNIMQVVNTLPTNLRSKIGDKFDYLYIGYGGQVQVRVPVDYKAKMINTRSGRFSTYDYLDGKQFVDPDILFVMADVQNRMKFIKDNEPKNIIFILSEEHKTKENAQTRFNDFIQKFGLKTDQYKFASEYKLPTRVNTSTGVRKKATPASTVKEVFEFVYDTHNNVWKFSRVHGDYEEAIEEATNVYTVIKDRDSWKKTDGTYLTYGTEYLKTIINNNDSLDKSQPLTFAVYTPKNFEKYAKSAYPFWTDLLPKKVMATDLQDVTRFLSKLGFDVEKNDKGMYDLTDERLRIFLPKDLERLIAKMNKAKNSFDDYYRKGELDRIRAVARLSGQKDPVTLKFIEYPKQQEKYDAYLANNYGTSKTFFRSISVNAANTKAWDMSYNKLVKLAKEAYEITD